MFFLRLPAQERSPEHADLIARSSPPAGAFGLPAEPLAAPESAIAPPVARLLVVEDNTDLQAFLRVILPSEYHLTVVGNGRAALEYLSDAEQLPDLILTDVMMPEMDGFQLLEALRHEAAWRPIPVILLTALAASDDRLRAFRIGIDDYITKPFSAEELIVRSANALRTMSSSANTVTCVWWPKPLACDRPVISPACIANASASRRPTTCKKLFLNP